FHFRRMSTSGSLNSPLRLDRQEVRVGGRLSRAHIYTKKTLSVWAVIDRVTVLGQILEHVCAAVPERPDQALRELEVNSRCFTGRAAERFFRPFEGQQLRALNINFDEIHPLKVMLSAVGVDRLDWYRDSPYRRPLQRARRRNQ